MMEEKHQPPELLPNNEPPVEKRRRFIINFIYFAILFALSVVIVRYALPSLVSFVIAYVVAVVLRPLVNFFVEKIKIDRKAISVLLVLLFYATAGVAIALLVGRIALSAGAFIKKLPELYSENIAPALTDAVRIIEDAFEKLDLNFELDIDLSDALNKVLTVILDTLTAVSKSLLSKAPQWALSLSNVLLQFVITIVSSCFILMDYDLISGFIHKQLPERTSTVIKASARHLGKVLKKYIFSYALIMFITFAEVFTGITIIGFQNTIAIAALIAVFDILPVVGSGMVLMPWAIIELILGNIGKGIGLIILWAFVVSVRQVIEPKIVGTSVGMHPFLTLFSMFLGNFIYGGVGILLLPVSLALCQSLNEAGIVHIYKPLEKEDTEKIKEGKTTIWLRRKSYAVGNRIVGFFKKLRDSIFKKNRKK